MTPIKFTVYGRPEPQGSTRAFIPKGWTRPTITSDNKKLKPWRQEITRAAMDALGDTSLPAIGRELPVALRLDFYLARPQSLQKRILRPIKKPDADKLIRAVLDSLTGSLFVDDSQVVQLMVGKWFGQPERVEIFASVAQPEAIGMIESDTYSLFQEKTA